LLMIWSSGVVERFVDEVIELAVWARVRGKVLALAQRAISGFDQRPGIPREVRERLIEHNIPVFDNGIRAVQAIAHLYRQQAVMQQSDDALSVSDALVETAQADEGLRSWRAAASILQALGVPVVPWRLASTPAKALEAADTLGYPVVLKLLLQDVGHKTERGLVHLDLRSREDVRRALDALEYAAGPEAREGFLLQRHIQGGLQALVGLTEDPELGRVLVLGVGGVMTEFIGQVAYALPPLSLRQAADLVDRSPLHVLLQGVRGAAAGDAPALSACVAAVSRLAEVGSIAEFEINPLLILPRGEGVCALDVLVRTTRSLREIAQPHEVATM
jgi:acetate---CoA ligase (ADP-forming)